MLFKLDRCEVIEARMRSVEKLTIEDIIALAAYAASLHRKLHTLLDVVTMLATAVPAKCGESQRCEALRVSHALRQSGR
jgi:hypothetical protein